jgi:hypothetical protein
MDTSKMKVPDGWRQLDLDIFANAAELEARVQRLEAHDKRDAQSEIKIRKAIIDLASDIQYLTQQLAKLDEVYYHVFPERLAQDDRFEKQMDSLTTKPKPNAGDGK